MSELRFTVTTKATPEAASGFLADPRNARRWLKNLDTAELVSGEPGTAGARYTLKAKGLLHSQVSEYEVTEVSPTRIVTRSQANSAEGVETVDLVPVAGGTELRYHATVAMKGLSRIATPFLGLAMDYVVDEDALVASLDELA